MNKANPNSASAIQPVLSSQPRWTVSAIARSSVCEWRFLQQMLGQSASNPESEISLSAYVKTLSDQQTERLANEYRSRGNIFRLNLEIDLPQLCGVIPLMWRGRTGWVVQIPRYSAHVRKDIKVSLGGFCALALSAGYDLAPWAEVNLSTGKTQTFLLSELLSLWQEQSKAAERIWQRWLTLNQLYAGDSNRIRRLLWYSCCKLCANCADCQRAIKQYDDPLQICGLGSGLRWELVKHGIWTAREFVENYQVLELPNINQRLFEQAKLQVESILEPTFQQVKIKVDPLAKIWSSLPTSDPGDVYLDFENNSLWDWNLQDHTGLVYLAGAVTWDETHPWSPPEVESEKSVAMFMNSPVPRGEDKNGKQNDLPVSVDEVSKNGIGHLSSELHTHYFSWWAHDYADEAQLLKSLVYWLENRRKQYPNFHVYHYSEQEVLYLRRLAGRHHCFEAEVLELTGPDGIFVDLLKVVQGAVLLGLPGYKLKHLEPLYMSNWERFGSVLDGGESVVLYDQWRRKLNSPIFMPRFISFPIDFDLPSDLLEIARYNEYDCNSTRQLHGWLIRQQRKALSGWVVK